MDRIGRQLSADIAGTLPAGAGSGGHHIQEFHLGRYNPRGTVGRTPTGRRGAQVELVDFRLLHRLRKRRFLSHPNPRSATRRQERRSRRPTAAPTRSRASNEGPTEPVGTLLFFDERLHLDRTASPRGNRFRPPGARLVSTGHRRPTPRSPPTTTSSSPPVRWGSPLPAGSSTAAVWSVRTSPSRPSRAVSPGNASPHPPGSPSPTGSGRVIALSEAELTATVPTGSAPGSVSMPRLADLDDPVYRTLAERLGGDEASNRFEVDVDGETWLASVTALPARSGRRSSSSRRFPATNCSPMSTGSAIAACSSRG